MVRHKNRYIVMEINQPNKNSTEPLLIKQKNLYPPIFNAVLELHGDFGMAAIRDGFTAKYCNEITRTALLRVRHGPHKLVASALPTINQIENKKVSINTLYVGATIKHCYNFLIKYQQRKFDEFCLSLKTDEEKAELKEQILNLDSIVNMANK